jgi:hypothetical protein
MQEEIQRAVADDHQPHDAGRPIARHPDSNPDLLRFNQNQSMLISVCDLLNTQGTEGMTTWKHILRAAVKA